MGLKDDLAAEIRTIFRERWSTRDGIVVPAPEDLKLSNDGVRLDGAVLYADLDGSTAMVDAKKPEFSAEIYKTYLHCCAKLIRSENGVITAYDGDRVMAVFIGENKCGRAVRCGLKINWVVIHLINPLLKECYPSTDFQIRQTVGIDTGSLLAARIGVRGGNDLVWVGPAANYAAKLTTLPPDYPTRITQRVFEQLGRAEKYSAAPERLMWEPRDWTPHGNMRIHRSNFWWPVG